MSGSDDDGKLSPEDQAALAEYENSDAAGAKAPTSHRAAELTKLFYKTAEMQDYTLTLAAINADLDPEDTVPVKIDVPRGFLRLVEFLEQKRASDAEVSPQPAPIVLSQLVVNELHDQFHWLTVKPAHFVHYRNLWNRFCDEQGAPEQKIAAPHAGAPEDGNGPF
jgi:hypothetical protein